jgi:O-methyltransferase
MGYAEDVYIDLLINCLTASLYDESAWKVIEGGRESGVTFLNKPVQFVRARIRDGIIRSLRRRSLLVVKELPFSAADRADGRDWPCFGYTMVGRNRLKNIVMCVENVLRDKVPGDLIETGAWRGGATILMRALLKLHGVKDRTVWVADSFEGLPEPASRADGADLSHVNYLKVSLEEVKANFERFGLLDDQVKFLKGWFRDTLPSASIKSLALLRLDGDLYSSTMDSLCNLYDRVSPGGFVIVDDYFSWAPCNRAVKEFLEKKRLDVQIQAIDGDGAFWQVTGQ